MLVVTDARIADLLLNKPEGVHVEVLAEQSGLDAGKLGRILRLLATKHCFKEGISHPSLPGGSHSTLTILPPLQVKPNVFANNRLSMKLLSVDPVGTLVNHL